MTRMFRFSEFDDDKAPNRDPRFPKCDFKRVDLLLTGAKCLKYEEFLDFRAKFEKVYEIQREDYLQSESHNFKKGVGVKFLGKDHIDKGGKLKLPRNAVGVIVEVKVKQAKVSFEKWGSWNIPLYLIKVL